MRISLGMQWTLACAIFIGLGSSAYAWHPHHAAYAAPGYAVGGYAVGGYAVGGYAVPGYAVSGYALAPGYAVPGYAASSYALAPVSGYAVGSYAMPSYSVAPFATGYALPSYGYSMNVAPGSASAESLLTGLARPGDFLGLACKLCKLLDESDSSGSSGGGGDQQKAFAEGLTISKPKKSTSGSDSGCKDKPLAAAVKDLTKRRDAAISELQKINDELKEVSESLKGLQIQIQIGPAAAPVVVPEPRPMPKGDTPPPGR